eukprot:777428-Rhodomonas_salina.1
MHFWYPFCAHTNTKILFYLFHWRTGPAPGVAVPEYPRYHCGVRTVLARDSKGTPNSTRPGRNC